jgi:DNA-binding transcriptional regulator YdaS (Cro superfamily)
MNQDQEPLVGMDLDEYLSQPGSLPATELAQRLEVNPDLLRQWRHRYKGRVPSPSNCVLIEKVTGGKVTRQRLRPDDWRANWPELDAASPRREVAAPTAADASSEHPNAPRPPVDAPAGPSFMLGDRRVRSGPNRGRRDDDRPRGEHSS